MLFQLNVINIDFKTIDSFSLCLVCEGLFEHGHMAYDDSRDDGPNGEPSLEEMTSKAIDILQKKPYGFFLMVEGYTDTKLFLSYFIC